MQTNDTTNYDDLSPHERYSNITKRAELDGYLSRKSSNARRKGNAERALFAISLKQPPQILASHRLRDRHYSSDLLSRLRNRPARNVADNRSDVSQKKVKDIMFFFFLVLFI